MPCAVTCPAPRCPQVVLNSTVLSVHYSTVLYSGLPLTGPKHSQAHGAPQVVLVVEAQELLAQVQPLVLGVLHQAQPVAWEQRRGQGRITVLYYTVLYMPLRGLIGALLEPLVLGDPNHDSQVHTLLVEGMYSTSLYSTVHLYYTV